MGKNIFSVNFRRYDMRKTLKKIIPNERGDQMHLLHTNNIFLLPTGHFHNFFLFQALLKKSFQHGKLLYIWIFINFYSLQTILKKLLLVIQFCRNSCVTYRTLFCNAFFQKHIYLFTVKKLTFIHQNYGVYSSFWSICFKKICICNLSDNYFLS